MNLLKPELNLEVPNDLMKVMHCYEDTCVLGCCGVECLDLDAQHAIDGMLDFGLDTAERALEQLNAIVELVRVHRGPVLSGQSFFGQHWSRSEEALLFLHQVHASLSAAIDHVGQHGLPNASV